MTNPDDYLRPPLDPVNALLSMEYCWCRYAIEGVLPCIPSGAGQQRT
ncbi:hypothetical protein [Pseudoflavonifractor capillosus]|uniref:Uncharacterized protein n=1 Tax=Pseudoflavonifractor capillosus TaxID=106588 RepID=A0A921SS97_9FIRM|nr:hypothetical protein [Pseudoflavonifractor capillosus]HJG86660.1 hypothetical protein [Pseudoflavonifractor capillosus]